MSHSNDGTKDSVGLKSIKQFELSLIRRKDRELEIDKVEGDDLVEVLAKFLLVIVQVKDRVERERRIQELDDDIPF